MRISHVQRGFGKPRGALPGSALQPPRVFKAIALVASLPPHWLPVSYLFGGGPNGGKVEAGISLGLDLQIWRSDRIISEK